MAEALIPVDVDEIVYRRVPVKQNYYTAENGYLSPTAFRATPNDLTGISVSRARFLKAAKAAADIGYEGEQYWIIELRVKDLSVTEPA